MKLCIIGSRTFDSSSILNNVLCDYFADRDGFFSFHTIISGGAKGADTEAARWAVQNKVKLVEYPADWATHGRAAGPIRNEQIIKDCDFVLAIWDGLSRGTANSLSIAKRLKKPTMIIYF